MLWLVDDDTGRALVSLPVAVEDIGTTARTIRRWIAAGRVRSRYIDGRVYVDLADLNQTEAATRRHGGKRRQRDKHASLS